MPSISQSLAASPTIYATEKPNAKIKPSLILVDNVIPVQNAVITLLDRFTPSVSNGVPIPVATTVTRLRINVSIMACVSIRDELKDIEILGQMELTIVTPDADCHATVAWDYI